MGLLPIAPLQTLTAIGLAFLFRLNRLAVLGGTLVWQPFTAPFIYAAEYGVGEWMRAALFHGAPGPSWEGAACSMGLGGCVVSAVGGAGFGLVAYAVMRRRNRRRVASSVLGGEEG